MNSRPGNVVPIKSAHLQAGEFNRVELLRDVSVWPYELSTKHYVAVRQSLGRLASHEEIRSFVVYE